MALQSQKLITLQNPTGSPITITWDDVVYTFAPSAKMTIATGVAASWREKNANLTITAERTGVTLDGVLGADITVTNDSDDALSLVTDEATYTFTTGEAKVIDAARFERLQISSLVTD